MHFPSLRVGYIGWHDPQFIVFVGHRRYLVDDRLITGKYMLDTYTTHLVGLLGWFGEHLQSGKLGYKPKGKYAEDPVLSALNRLYKGKMVFEDGHPEIYRGGSYYRLLPRTFYKHGKDIAEKMFAHIRKYPEALLQEIDFYRIEDAWLKGGVYYDYQGYVDMSDLMFTRKKQGIQWELMSKGNDTKPIPMSVMKAKKTVSNDKALLEYIPIRDVQSSIHSTVIRCVEIDKDAIFVLIQGVHYKVDLYRLKGVTKDEVVRLYQVLYWYGCHVQSGNVKTQGEVSEIKDPILSGLTALKGSELVFMDNYPHLGYASVSGYRSPEYFYEHFNELAEKVFTELDKLDDKIKSIIELNTRKSNYREKKGYLSHTGKEHYDLGNWLVGDARDRNCYEWIIN